MGESVCKPLKKTMNEWRHFVVFVFNYQEAYYESSPTRLVSKVNRQQYVNKPIYGIYVRIIPHGRQPTIRSLDHPTANSIANWIRVKADL